MNNNCPEDDWGCVPDDELFINAGPTLSFHVLMKQFIADITKLGGKYKEELMDDDDKVYEERELSDSINNRTKDVVEGLLPLRYKKGFKSLSYLILFGTSSRWDNLEFGICWDLNMIG